jgi:hypothetical protein
MIRALAVSGSTASIPFGAAHRVNFDTPPLKGWRSLPGGSERDHVENLGVSKTALANGIDRCGVFPSKTGGD